MSNLIVLDPLTLVGRELLQLLGSEASLAHEVSYFHTEDDDEHQIAEFPGRAGLVPPLDSPGDLDGCEAILVATERDSARLAHLVRHLEHNAGLPVVVAGRPASLRDIVRPAAGIPRSGAVPQVQLRVAHPALVAVSVVAEALGYLGPDGGMLAAVDPVSSLGRDAVVALARQAGQRLQGAPVDELTDGMVLAFTTVAAYDDELAREAAEALPELPLAVTRSISGRFHGHVAHIGLGFSSPVDEDEVVNALSTADSIAWQEDRLSLDQVSDSDLVSVLRPHLSPDRRFLGVTAMVDGLLLGGARTALDLLRAILIPSR